MIKARSILEEGNSLAQSMPPAQATAYRAHIARALDQLLFYAQLHQR